MSNDLTDEQLIELAKLAKPVPVPIEEKKRNGPTKIGGTPLFDFMQAVGLRAGKFEVSLEDLYLPYTQWTDKPLDIREFSKELKKFFKVSSKKYKVNMREITLLERVQGIKDEKVKT